MGNQPEKDIPQPRRATRGPVATSLAFLLVAVCLGFVAHRVAAGWPDLAEREWSLSPGLAGASLALLLFHYLFGAWAWQAVFRSLGERTSFANTFAILYTAQIGKYIPGKIWMILGQVYLAEKLGHRKASALTAGVLQNLCGTSAALFIVGGSLIFLEKQPLVAATCLVIAHALILLLLIAPARVENLVNRFRRRRDLEPVRIAAGRAATQKVFLFMTLAWMFHCAAFAFLVASVTKVGADAFFELSFAYALSYIVAFYTIIVPGGLGVREGGITALLSPLLGQAPAGLIALLQRAWSLLGELLVFVPALLIAKKAVTRHQETHGRGNGESDKVA